MRWVTLDRRSLLVSVTLISAISACGSRKSEASHETSTKVSGGQLVLSDSGLGPFRYDATIASLRASWPTSRDSSVPWEYGTYAAVELSRPGARVIVQQSDSVLHANKPGDVWFLRGDSIILPKRLRPDSRWGEVRRAYGKGWGSEAGAWYTDNMNYSTFGFCSVPYLFFIVLNLGVDSTAPLPNPASIPDTTRPVSVFVDWDKVSLVPCDSTSPGDGS